MTLGTESLSPAATDMLSRGFWVVLGVFILWVIVRALLPRREGQERAAAFGRMGFTEVTPAAAFGADANLLARLSHDAPTASLSPWVETGRSAIGPAFLFEYHDEFGTGGVSSNTVVAFALPDPMPDFEVAHVEFLDRFFHGHTRAAAPAQATAGVPSQLQVGPFALVARPLGPSAEHRVEMEGNPAFAAKYVVWSADPAATRRLRTPRLMAALLAKNDHHLHIKHATHWLMIYRLYTHPTPPRPGTPTS